jgi:hypothetical protein
MTWSYEKAKKVAAACVMLAVEMGFVELDEGEEVPAPTPIANGSNPSKPKRTPAPKPGPDVAANANAAAPAAPAPAEPAPARTMMPMCKKHAADAPPGVKPIPAEESACVPCVNDKTLAQTKASKGMTLEQAKVIAEALIESRPDGGDICWMILQTLGAESLTGNQGTTALDPSKYEDFAKQCDAATTKVEAPAKTVRRSL